MADSGTPNPITMNIVAMKDPTILKIRGGSMDMSEGLQMKIRTATPTHPKRAKNARKTTGRRALGDEFMADRGCAASGGVPATSGAEQSLSSRRGEQVLKDSF